MWSRTLQQKWLAVFLLLMIGDALAFVKIWSGLVWSVVAFELLVGFHLNMPICWTIV